VAAAPFHDFDSRVPAPLKARLEELRGQIIDGSLDVSTPYDPS
jgi:nucleoside-binding protein